MAAKTYTLASLEYTPEGGITAALDTGIGVEFNSIQQMEGQLADSLLDQQKILMAILVKCRSVDPVGNNTAQLIGSTAVYDPEGDGPNVLRVNLNPIT